MKKLWGTRFKAGTNKRIEKIISSLPFDVRLAKYDVEGSIAHAAMLGKTKIIPRKDANRLVQGLKRIQKKLKQGTLKPNPQAEDVHTWVQMLLKQEVGSVAGKLHTARSRNDQVVLDERLYTKDQGRQILSLIKDLQRAILKVAVREQKTAIPAYTHLRRAQCVSVALHMTAYIEMLAREMTTAPRICSAISSRSAWVKLPSSWT